MSKFMLAFAITVLSLASVSAQPKAGATSGPPQDMAGTVDSVITGWARVLDISRPGENRTKETSTEALSPAYAASFNHASPRNESPKSGDAPLNNSTNSAPSKTRPRNSVVTAGTIASSSTALSQIYRVGVGDVLDVQLVDMPSAKSTLFTVLEGGLLDYPLSNAPVPVAGLTAEEIATQLRARIKVLDNPRVVVKVRDYSSHSVIVTGFVFDPGAKFLRREAMPLFVVLAEAQPRPEAVSATILRGGVPVINIDLKDQNSVAMLVVPGDLIKVSGPAAEPAGFFYTGGALSSPGQKAFYNGLTLTQAILASGGVTRAAGNRVKVSRQRADGRLNTTEYNLRQIQEGKTPDPALQRGDRITVGEARQFSAR